MAFGCGDREQVQLLNVESATQSTRDGSTYFFLFCSSRKWRQAAMNESNDTTRKDRPQRPISELETPQNNLKKSTGEVRRSHEEKKDSPAPACGMRESMDLREAS